MLRVAADVNTLVEGAISKTGPAGALLGAWERGDVALVLSEEIIAEYEEVLNRPHIRRKYAHITAVSIGTSVAAFRTRGVLVPLTDVPRMISADPDDDILLAVAVAGGAAYLVSRDHHLRRLESYRGIPIVSPEAFAAILRGQVSEELAIAYAFGR